MTSSRKTAPGARTQEQSVFDLAVPSQEVLPHDMDLTYFIDSTTRNIGGKFGLFIEAFLNSWQAKFPDEENLRLEIFIQGSGDDFEIIFRDNGRGMGKVGRKAFTDLALSPYRDVVGSRSKHGYGRLRWKSDFRCVEVIDCAATDVDGKARIIRFDWQELLDAFGKSGERIQVREIARGKVAAHVPLGQPGTYIRLFRPTKDGQRYTERDLIRHLAEHLAPWEAEKVTVNAKPLEIRKLDHPVLTWDEPNHYALGKVRIRLFLPGKPSLHDQLIVGTVEPICEWSEFAKLVPEDEWDSELELLNLPMVKGHLYFSVLTDFRSGTSTSFEVRLSRAKVLSQLLNYLRLHVTNKLRTELDVLGVSGTETRKHQLLHDLDPLLEALGGTAPKKRPPTGALVIEVHPMSLELCPGDTEIVRLVRKDPDIKEVVVDASESGGRLRRGSHLVKDRDTYEYTAGPEIGRWKLVWRDKDRPQVFVTQYVDIRPLHHIRVKPKTATLEFGARQPFAAIGWEDASSGEDNLVWRLDSRDREGSFVVTARGHELQQDTAMGSIVMYQAGSVGGTFTIEVFDRKAGRAEALASAAVTVTEAAENLLPADDADYAIGGIGYKLKLWDQAQPVMSSLSFKGKRPQVDLYLGHPGFEAALYRGRAAFTQEAFNQVLLQHIAYVNRDLGSIPARTLLEMLSALHEKVAKKVGERS